MRETRTENEKAADFPVRRAMVLAAGLGTRLRPLTDHLPKPLLPVLGRPLLEIVLDRLAAIGVSAIGVNLHQGRERIARFLKRYAGGALPGRPEATELPRAARGRGMRRGEDAPGVPRPVVTPFVEPEILGTGGALRNAAAFLSEEESFLLHNADVFCDADLEALVREHRRGGAVATLLLVDEPRVNTVRVAADGRILALGGPPPDLALGQSPGEAGRPAANGRRAGGSAVGDAGERGERALTYTGIAVLRRELLDFLPEGPSSLVEALRAAMADDPESVRGFAPGGFTWSDLGTVKRLLEVHSRLLKNERAGRSTGTEAGLHLAPGAVCEEGARWSGFLALGPDARVRAGSVLRDCVVLEGVTVPAGTRAEEAVLGPGWIVTRRENERHRLREAAQAVLRGGNPPHGYARPITGHGSDRAFWRLREEELAAVLMQVPRDDPDFKRFVVVGRFLWEEGFGGPEIFDTDPEERTVLMEDLGERSLLRVMTEEPEGRDPDRRRKIYFQVVERLVDLQVRGTRRVDEGACPPAGDRLFDYDTLRWETDYFRRRFLREFAGVPEASLAGLDEEFHRLAVAVLAQPVVLLHRDFQSQNILLPGGAVRLVDFQGMRRGPLLYDLLSLVRDAYVELDPNLRRALLEHHRRSLLAAGGPALAPEEHFRMAVAAGLQRNMQALGAFAFLSEHKGKRGFLAHVPLALRHLTEGLEEARGLGDDLLFPRLSVVLQESAERARRKAADASSRSSSSRPS